MIFNKENNLKNKFFNLGKIYISLMAIFIIIMTVSYIIPNKRIDYTVSTIRQFYRFMDVKLGNKCR